MRRQLPLHLAWLGLVVLTLAGALAGEGAVGGWRLDALVLGLILGKGWLVARYFLEIHVAHPLIRGLILAYIGLVAGLVVMVAGYGPLVARLTSLD